MPPSLVNNMHENPHVNILKNLGGDNYSVKLVLRKARFEKMAN